MKKFLNLTNIFWTVIILVVIIFSVAMERKSKQITFEVVANADFSNLYSKEFPNEKIVFVNGQYRKTADIFSTLIIQLPFATGDINSDFLTDYAIIVLHGEKASFSSCDIILVLNQNGKPYPSQKIQVPKNTTYCDPTSLQIRANKIILEKNSFEFTKFVYEFKDGILSNASNEK